MRSIKTEVEANKQYYHSAESREQRRNITKTHYLSVYFFVIIIISIIHEDNEKKHEIISVLIKTDNSVN